MFKSYKILWILTALLFGCSEKALLYKDAICIYNINLINAEEGLSENQTIVIQDGKIIKVASSTDLLLSEKNEIIDGTGKYMIPGLWDAHVHFAYIEELAPSMFDLFLKYGITSVRDTGGKIKFVNEWKQKSLANPSKAPRVMIAGPLLDGEPNVYDGSDAGHPELSVGLENVKSVEEQIEILEKEGVDLLKAYEMLSPEQFRRIMELAKEKGLKVTGHVPLSMDVITASNAGLNSMEHMRNLELSCASNAEELLIQRRNLLDQGKKETGGILRSNIHGAQREQAITNFDENKAEEVLEALKRNDTWQIPTMALNTLFSGRYFSRSEWQADYALLPDSIGVSWQKRSDELTEMEPPPFRAKYSDWFIMMISKIHKKGIPIMAGTDSPIAYLTPGRSLHEELAVLVNAGLSPLEALKTATINPAKYFDMDHELGRIKEGYLADLVILDRNPLEDIKNTTTISSVIKNGEFVDLDELETRLKN